MSMYLFILMYFQTIISKIDSFVLLDLLGAKDPSFYNYFPQFSKLFEHIASVEQRLVKKNMYVPFVLIPELTMLYSLDKRDNPFFKMISLGQSVEDDRIFFIQQECSEIDLIVEDKPFLELGVKVLHLIPVPFPRSWHTQQDDRASLDLPTIDALSKIIKVFVAEYLGI